MNWIFITVIVSIFIILLGLLSSYHKGFKEGYNTGIMEAELLEDGNATYSQEGKHEGIS
jgi:hypothetical protein